MATKLLVCPECAVAVGPGRLACASCGAILASVGNTSRSVAWTEPLALPIVTSGPPPVEPPIAAPVERKRVRRVAPRSTIGPAWAHGPLERAPGETDLEVAGGEAATAVDTNVPAWPIAATEQPTEPEQIAVAGLWPEAVLAPIAPLVSAAADPAADPDPEPDPDPGAIDEDAPLAVATVPPQAPEPRWPESRTWPPPDAGPAPLWHPRPDARPRAGAYVPPSAEPIADASSRTAPASVPSSPPPPVVEAPVAMTKSPSTETTRHEPGRLPELGPELGSQVVAIGAGIAAVGFLLPWAAIVIGSGRIGGFLNQWGLAGPGHPLIFLVIVALAAAASQVKRLPAWARPGLPAAIIAGLLVGLVWPYLFGTLQPTIGVFVTLVGAVVLAAGGLLDLWVQRHGEEPRPV